MHIPVFLALVLCLLTGCGMNGKEPITSFEQLGKAGTAIGVGSDLPQWKTLQEDYPEAEVIAITDKPLAYEDVANGRMDAFVGARREMELAMENGTTGVRLLDEDYGKNTVAVGLSPKSSIPDIQKKINTFITEMKADGTLDDMYERWVVQADYTMPEIDMPEHPEYHLRVGTTGTVMPYSYFVGTELYGYDIELAYRFAAWLGADIEFKIYDFGGIVTAAAAGDVDCIMSNLYRTEENEKQIPFSDSIFDVAITAMVQDTGTMVQNGSFWSSVADSFEKTFLRENRWKLFLQGIGTTLLITVLSILFGTLLGFIVFMLCRNGNPVANTITRFFVWLVRGMPAVVLLMILYYVIFGNVAISGTAVSVTGFTLVFAAGVYGTIKSGVNAIDPGQLEAAYSLGYTNRRAFYRVILPQAVPHFMPAYKSSITEIIKATAIVGYVAVQDLTKMGDIVRSRTYEAFFPLIAVAVIYFILAAVLTFIVNCVELHIDPKRRRE